MLWQYAERLVTDTKIIASLPKYVPHVDNKEDNESHKKQSESKLTMTHKSLDVLRCYLQKKCVVDDELIKSIPVWDSALDTICDTR